VKSKIEKILERIVEIAIYGLIFIIPFSKAGIEIFGITAIVAWSIKTLLMRSNPLASLPKYVVFTLSLLFLANLASCVVSVSLAHSMKALFTKTLEYMLFFLIVAEVFSDAKKIKILLKVVFVSISLFYIDGIIQYITGIDLVRKNFLCGTRITGSMLSPNDFGTYAIIFIPILFSFVVAKNQPLGRRIVISVIFSTALLCIFFSYSRASWVGFIVMVLFFIFVKNKWLFFFFVLFSVISLFPLQDFVKESMRKENIQNKVFADPGTYQRFFMAKEAISIIIDYPVSGTGLNTYTTVAPKYKLHRFGGIYPHNSYLHKTAETGLVGIGAFFLFVWSLYSIGIRSLWLLSSKNMTNNIEYILIRGLMAGLVGLLVNAFFDTTLYALMLITTFWIISGILIAACNVTSQKLKLDFKTINK